MRGHVGIFRANLVGEGAAVHAGCGRGEITAAIAEWMKGSGHPGPLWAYDFFKDGEAATKLGLPAKRPREDFYQDFRSNVSRFGDFVRSWIGDICAKPAPGTIALMVVDLPDTAHVSDHLVREFFPELLTGALVSLRHDFIGRYGLNGHFEQVDGATYRVVEPISRAAPAAATFAKAAA